MEVFQVKVIIAKKVYELFFSTKELAEDSINTIQNLMTDEGKKNVKFIATIIPIITSEEEVKNAFLQSKL